MKVKENIVLSLWGPSDKIISDCVDNTIYALAFSGSYKKFNSLDSFFEDLIYDLSP